MVISQIALEGETHRCASEAKGLATLSLLESANPMRSTSASGSGVMRRGFGDLDAFLVQVPGRVTEDRQASLMKRATL